MSEGREQKKNGRKRQRGVSKVADGRPHAAAGMNNGRQCGAELEQGALRIEHCAALTCEKPS
jgi:hypothetical protein